MIKSIDHMVITTADLDKCLHFYADLLGMDSIYMYDPDGNLVEIAVYRPEL